MFCKNVSKSSLSCSLKWVSEIISIGSIIFNTLVIIPTCQQKKLNVTDKLILQIIVSEIIDGFDILLIVLDDSIWPRTFENFYFRRGICFSQIFLSLFSCLWTLIASFFISLRIYDLSVKKNTIFKKKIMKKTLVFSILIPFFISFCFWIGQIKLQVDITESLSLDSLYKPSGSSRSHFRHMHCWYEKDTHYIIFAIALLLISAEFFFSGKGISVMCNIKMQLTEALDIDGSFHIQKKKSDVEYIIRTLWVYPVTSAILWLLFFILQIIFFYSLKEIFSLSLIYCIIISIRQFIYTLVFLFTQKKIRKEFIRFITFRSKKKDESIIYGINNNNALLNIPTENEENSPIN